MLTTSKAVVSDAAPEEPPGVVDRHRLTATQGLAALSLDAMASVAYGPEAVVLVLASAGAYGLGFTLPVTLAIAGLLAVLVASYRQVIAAFPNGGGSYAVARRHLGARASLVAAASLILDYVLNVAVSVTAGVAALTSAFPGLYGDRLVICLGVLVLVTAVNPRRQVVDPTKRARSVRPRTSTRRSSRRDVDGRSGPFGAQVVDPQPPTATRTSAARGTRRVCRRALYHCSKANCADAAPALTREQGGRERGTLPRQ
ncbi:hypothetical protein SXANM310S_05900 [Streptomyces xanthochromogenes]